jgi:hypothetical protein
MERFPGKGDTTWKPRRGRLEFGSEHAEVWSIAAAGRFVIAFVHRGEAAGESGVCAAEVCGIVMCQ